MRLTSITPKAVELIELVTLGLGSKRGDDSKIGHKGSGMKFTLALLHRLGSSLTVTVGGRTWRSVASEVTVRGQAHTLIDLIADDGEVMRANIALEAGSDTWTEAWYAIREITQNALDEGGYMTTAENHPPVPDGTIMSIPLTEELEIAFHRRSDWHHERHHEVIYPRGERQGGMFYHGFRISTEADWEFCYDVTNYIKRSNLSEDRQAKGIHMSDMFTAIICDTSCPPLQSYIYGEFITAKKPDIVQLLRAIYYSVSRSKPDTARFLMAELDAAFISRHGKKAVYTGDQAVSDRDEYYAKAEGFSVISVPSALSSVLHYSSVIRHVSTMIPTLAARLKPVSGKEINLETKDRLKQATHITRSLRPLGCKVDVVDSTHKDDTGTATCAMADIEANRVMLMRSWCERSSVNEIVCGLIEEYTHINSQSGDCTTAFEKELIRVIASLVTPTPRVSRKETAFSL